MCPTATSSKYLFTFKASHPYNNTNITMQGKEYIQDDNVSGTFCYLPEESLAGFFSHATDVFSLGALLYYVKTGSPLIHTTIEDDADTKSGCRNIHLKGRVISKDVWGKDGTMQKRPVLKSGAPVRETLTERVGRNMKFLTNLVKLMIHPFYQQRINIELVEGHSDVVLAARVYSNKSIYDGMTTFVTCCPVKSVAQATCFDRLFLF